MRDIFERFLALLESHVGAAQTLTTEAYVLARETHVGLDDINTQVLLERLRGAAIYLGGLLCAMDEELEDYGERSVAEVGELAARFRPRIRPRRSDPRSYLEALVRTAARRARDAQRLFSRVGTEPDSKIAISLERGAHNLEVAAHVLGVAGRPWAELDEATQLHREWVLDRRRPPADGTEMAAR